MSSCHQIISMTWYLIRTLTHLSRWFFFCLNIKLISKKIFLITNMIWGPKIDHFIINNAILKGKMYKNVQCCPPLYPTLHYWTDQQLYWLYNIEEYIEYRVIYSIQKYRKRNRQKSGGNECIVSVNKCKGLILKDTKTDLFSLYL